MDIMVFDVPAERGGALSVLNDFYNDLVEHSNKSINWIFVLSTPNLKETSNIKVLRFPWVKKSWGHRYYFDHVIAPKLVKQYKVDKIFSLQNVVIPHVKCEQVLYVHQPLPFVEYKFPFKENKLFWMYQNIISKNILKSIKKAHQVIVQTEWMKKACIEKAAVEDNKIKIIPPTINTEIKKYFEPTKESLSTFFYPAGASYYKNHRLIVEACKKLREQGFNEYKVIFTLHGNENKHIVELYRTVQEYKLPIHFIGSISRERVFEYYSESVLLFPSYIETFGLPMLESKLHKGIIFAANTQFSKEILHGYPNAYFYNNFNPSELLLLMKQIMNHELNYQNTKHVNSTLNNDSNMIINSIL